MSLLLNPFVSFPPAAGGIEPPYDIVLVVANSASLDTDETNVDTLLSINHNVTPVTHTSYQDVGDGYDIAVLAPDPDGTFFNTNYHADQADSCAILDLQANPYRRYISDSDDTPNTRFDFTYFEDSEVWYSDDSVIPWEETEGLVTVLDSALPQNITLLPGAITASPYTPFLYYANGSSIRTDFLAGFYVPVGATLVNPDTLAEVESVAPYIYLNLFRGSEATYATLNSAGDALIEACLYKLMNP